MSYAGSPFEYDVFVSYAHAEAETGASLIRDWCKHNAVRLQNLLSSALNPSIVSDFKVKFFLDDRILVSGQPLTETLRHKVERSALLLVLMSPLYPQKDWCLDELDWFLKQADRDGRSQQHCIVLRIQPLPAWPDRLKDERGSPVFFRDLADPETELPLGLDDFEAPALKNAMRQTFIEIKGKLKELRNQVEARRSYEQATLLPDQPVLYLLARLQDFSAWQVARARLCSLAIVNPDSLSVSADEDVLLQRQREQRLKEYALCDGIVPLRAHSEDSTHIQVMAVYKDRQKIFQERRLNIPWAILDQVGSHLPVASVHGSYRTENAAIFRCINLIHKRPTVSGSFDGMGVSLRARCDAGVGASGRSNIHWDIGIQKALLFMKRGGRGGAGRAARGEGCTQ